MLAGAGNCIDCHTAPGGPANAGGKPTRTRVGNFYSTNLTPDPETGIGAWSEAAFTRALREGVSRDGRHLFPVFPYTHYTQLDDADVRALYAYFMTRPPVKAPNRPNTAVFPIDGFGVGNMNNVPLQDCTAHDCSIVGPHRPNLIKGFERRVIEVVMGCHPDQLTIIPKYDPVRRSAKIDGTADDCLKYRLNVIR